MFGVMSVLSKNIHTAGKAERTRETRILHSILKYVRAEEHWTSKEATEQRLFVGIVVGLKTDCSRR